MCECYAMELSEKNIRLTPLADTARLKAVQEFFQTDESVPPEGYEFVCQMGDPDLLHCLVWRYKHEAGGVFIVFDGEGVLCLAEAKSNLLYALGMSYFGKIVANARYGVDIFENMVSDDDD